MGRVYWTAEERDRVVAEGVRLWRLDSRLTRRQLLIRAAKAEGVRPRDLKSVNPAYVDWFFTGVDAALAPPAAPPEPIAATAAPPEPMALEAASSDAMIAVLLARSFALHEADRGLVDALALDVQAIKGRVGQVAERLEMVTQVVSSFRGMLARLLGELDPLAAEQVAPPPSPPPPRPEAPMPSAPRPAPPPRPRIALVGCKPNQANAVLRGVGEVAIVRHTMESSAAVAKGFENFDHVIITRHAKHAAYLTAREQLGPDRVHRLRQTSARAVVEQVREIVRQAGA